MNSYHYSSPPKGYSPYYFNSSPTSPNNSDYIYYAPQQQYGTSSAKKHSRTRNYQPTATAQRPGGWHSPPGYPSAQFYETVPNYTTPPQRGDYVSTAKGMRSKFRTSSMSAGKQHSRTTRTQKQPVYVDVVDDAYNSPQYIYREPKAKTRHAKPSADQYFFFNQDQIYNEQPKRSRARRSSTTTRTPQKSAQSAHTKSPHIATEDDAQRAGIPAGYSIKNWDPTELPIVLLGSVFDANSLGKWIYDWTVFHHGASSPMADVAGDLWLLLIKLAGKMKRAEECVDRIRSIDSQEMVEDFLTSGSRLWQKFKQLLKACEQFMWRAAKREGSKGISMGKNAGTEFVDSIFGRDRELETTEKIMTSIRLWNMRFDANCEDILRRPSAA
ncbi:hypothetical protein EPUS_05766 [Endocarpon pusillum Z07020]|uniref:Vegetative cell wall protein gp1 n=1 Tax=Endocarpon pusillum (strain Z07020 / HMAS-L-300199) TaxID=1263415 RepID=U1HF62_ENDPU|nr:uncharacterized protein EPUS_05766 [Endocarpon pusillum Z07020]ERF68705.1 hypothetical protein EPUS_05766 [Endocarpon pusillum Z07020]